MLASALAIVGIASEFFRLMSSFVSFVSWGGANQAWHLLAKIRATI